MGCGAHDDDDDDGDDGAGDDDAGDIRMVNKSSISRGSCAGDDAGADEDAGEGVEDDDVGNE